MTEKKTEVRTFMVRMMCDKCGEGEMKQAGFAFMSNPPQYMHKCNNCGIEATFPGGNTYPRIEYEEVALAGRWMAISNAPKDGCHARDTHGVERWTWVELGDWVYEQWLKSSKGEDCLCFIPWNPVEWRN